MDGVALQSYRVGAELLDIDGQWRARRGVSDAGAVLLRPDGYIAYCG